CLAGERPAYLAGEYRPPDDAPRLLATPGHTAYLKIADGCDNRCTYCAIPAIRGPYRSRRRAAILKEAEELAQQGVREISLVAQDITLYGQDRGEGRALPALLRSLAAIPGIAWIRLLYAYPERITPELIETMATEKKICAYLDLPLQHGSDSVLRRMGRKTTAKKLLELIGCLRTAIPGITLRSTFIVGFPGETENDFARLLFFLEEAGLDRVGFFAYSQEEGTPAAHFPGQISTEVKKERLEVATDRQSRIVAVKQQALVGRRLQALVDGYSAQDPNVLLLRSYRQAPEVDGYIRAEGARVESGTFVTVKINGYDGYDLLGTIETEQEGKL
ncbi:MAG TPA: MiaB/RimO family radical SAM methylthiotransferase, partial [Firmicutes bacterium]|nr:MiaB/RimO family radical SAM methylthiotransferase [Bacillota bacterium]